MLIRLLQSPQPCLRPGYIREVRRKPQLAHAAQEEMVLQVGIGKRHPEEMKLRGINGQSSILHAMSLFFGDTASVHPATHEDLGQGREFVLSGNASPEVEILTGLVVLLVTVLPQYHRAGHAGR